MNKKVSLFLKNISDFIKNNKIFVISNFVILLVSIISFVFNLKLDVSIPGFSSAFNFSQLGSGLNLSIPIGVIGLFVLFVEAYMLMPNIIMGYSLFLFFVLSGYFARYVDVVGFLFIIIFLLKKFINLGTIIRLNSKQVLSKDDVNNVSLNNFPYIIFFGLFALSALISIFNSQDYFYSFFWLFLLLFLYFGYIFLPFNLFKNEKQILNVFKILSFIGVFSAILGVLSLIKQFVIDKGVVVIGAYPIDIFGNFIFGNNRNTLAQVLIVGAISLLFLFYFEKIKKNKYIYLVLLGFVLLINMLTLSRNSALTLSICFSGAIFFVYLIDFLKNKKWKNLIVSIILISLTAILFVKTSLHLQGVLQREDYNGSIVYRAGVAEISFGTLFEKHEVIGNGFGMYRGLMGQNSSYQKDYIYGIPQGFVGEAHSFVQKIIVEQGILGILTFLLFLGVVFINSLLFILDKNNSRQNKLIVIFTTTIALSQVMYNLLDMTYYTLRMWLVLSLPVIAVSVLKKEKYKS